MFWHKHTTPQQFSGLKTGMPHQMLNKANISLTAENK